MSGTLVGILGFACIVAIVVTLFKSKTLPSIAFIVFPMILALVLVSWENIIPGRTLHPSLRAAFPAPVPQRPCSCSVSCISVS